MKLGCTILYVGSVPQTIAFYERAFGLRRGMVTDTLDYGELQTGDTKLAFAANSFVKDLLALPFDVASPFKAAASMEVGLVTETAERDFERGDCAAAQRAAQGRYRSL